MMRKVRYDDFLQEVGIRYDEVRYADVIAAAREEGPRVHLRRWDAFHILRPYITPRLAQQLRAVVPLALYLVAFQFLFLRQPVSGGWTVTLAMFGVIVGLMLFMEGLRLGLMPLGERIGETLPKHRSLPVVLAVVFVLGIGVTLAEPAIGALQAAGAMVLPEQAPLLHALLTSKSGWLVLAVGIGVGLAAVIGTLRFVRNWSLKPLIYASVLPCLALTLIAYLDPARREIIGLAWDSGAVTTGPVTVPIVLALGIGVAAAVGKGSSSLSGFGIVTLASLFPVLGVLILGFVVEPDGTLALSEAPGQAAWWTLSPTAEIIASLRAIVPLVLFLVLVLAWIVRKRIRHPQAVAFGVVLTLVGMIAFNLGLTYGLAALGNQSGGALPAAFTGLHTVPGSPFYSYAIGLGAVIAFAWLLGFGATLAEPALNALGLTVEQLTNGAFPSKLLLMAVAAGVALGIALGVVKLVYALDLSLFLIPGYLLLLVLTYLSSEEYVNVAWDSAGVTTGPVTVPLVLAMGLGLGDAVQAPEGFGVLALASLCPIALVLLCGLYVRWRTGQRDT